MRKSALPSLHSKATAPHSPAAGQTYLVEILLKKPTNFNCEAVGSFALRHSPAQDEVGGSAQASQVVGEQDGVLCLGADLDEELLLGYPSN